MNGTGTGQVRRFVTFRLGEESYGFDINKVTIIEEMKTITRVPKTPEFVLGVINLRGEIVPVIDLRKRLNLPPVEYTEDTRIVILKHEDISAGFVVDQVTEVIAFSEDSIENVSSVEEDSSQEFVDGVGKSSGRLYTLLSVERLLKIA